MLFIVSLLLFSLPLISQFADAFIDIDPRNCLKRQCFEELGCFSPQDFIDQVKETLFSKDKLVDNVKSALALKQLLSICPIHPTVMNVSFLLFADKSNPRSHARLPYNPTRDQLALNTWQKSRPLAVIIHGYTDGFKECSKDGCDWMATMRNVFLARDFNVLCLDWSKPANDLNYFNSAFNTQIVGAILANFLSRLRTAHKELRPESVHLVGHSLGAHVSGFAGKKLKVGRISGLDPAGPGFSHFRLAKEDAHLVVVSHTSAGIFKDVDGNESPIETIQFSGFLGLSESIGHLDFWPNGGNGQPGCEKLTKDFIQQIVDSPLSGLKERGGCSHSRATQLPTTRPRPLCHLIGYKCKSYEDFLLGSCADCGPEEHACRPLEFDFDYYSDPKKWNHSMSAFPNDFYLKTAAEEPFCLFHYRIKVSMAESAPAGTIRVAFITDKKPVEVLFTSSVTGFSKDQELTQLVTSEEDWGHVTNAEAELEDNLIGKARQLSKKLNPFRAAVKSKGRVKSIELLFMSNSNAKIRREFSAKLILDENNNENEMENVQQFIKSNH